MQTLLSKVSLACCTTLLALTPLSNAAIASPPPLTKVPQTTSTPKTSVTPKTTPVQTPVKTEAIAPVVTPLNQPSATTSTPATTTPAATIPSAKPITAPAGYTVTNPTKPATAPAGYTVTNPTKPATTPAATTVTNPTKPATTPAATTVTDPAKTNTATTTVNDNKNLVNRLELILGERKVYAYKDNKVVASYPVAVGKKGWETPSGNFQVIQKIKDPVWENPWNGKKIPASLKGPIGVRWIGFWTDGKNTVGFHGTPNESLLGQAVSHGCVRMSNKDVVALFEMVEPGTPVIVKSTK